MALPLALALVGTQGAAASKAREAAGAAHADAAAKKCKRPKARHRGRCVRHCPDGTFVYHRYTPTSDSDINTYGSFYSWDVRRRRRHGDRPLLGPGNFPPSPPSQNLGPLRYQQPTDCGA